MEVGRHSHPQSRLRLRYQHQVDNTDIGEYDTSASDQREQGGCDTCTVVGPGQTPGSKCPSQALSPVFWQMPVAPPFWHCFTLQHCTSFGPLQKPASLNP